MIDNRHYKTIIFDTNNLYYKNFEVFKNLTYTINDVPMNTGGIYGSIKSIMSLVEKYLIENGQTIFVFDNCRSKDNLRKEIDPAYKSNRLEKNDRFFKGLDYLEKIIMHLYDNSKIVRLPYYEADDLLPAIIKQESMYDRILLISNDKDWSRNLTNNIDQYDGHNIVTKYSFKEQNGFYPNDNNLILYKTFKGDASDNIPNAIPKFPKNILIDIINNNKFEDIWDFFDQFDKGLLQKHFIDSNSNWVDKLNDRQIRERMIKNYKLVNFLGCDNSDLSEGTFICKYNPKILRILYSSFGFNIEKLDERINKNIKITNFNF